MTFCSSVKILGGCQFDMNLNASVLATARASRAIQLLRIIVNVLVYFRKFICNVVGKRYVCDVLLLLDCVLQLEK